MTRIRISLETPLRTLWGAIALAKKETTTQLPGESRQIHLSTEGFPMNMISDFLSSQDILLDVTVASKGQLFQVIGEHMEQAHALQRGWVVESLARREKAGSTALGEGVAIPHARVNGLGRIRVIYMRLATPIPFDAPDDKPVSDILVLLVPKPATEEHLLLLANAAEMFSDGSFRKQVGLCTDPAELKRLFDAWRKSMA